MWYDDLADADRLQRLLEQWRDAADTLHDVERHLIPVRSYEKSLRSQIAETWEKHGLWAGREPRQSLWAAMLEVAHNHSLPSTRTPKHNPHGTGLKHAWREARTYEKCCGAAVKTLERAIERDKKATPKARHPSLFDLRDKQDA